MFIEAKLVLQSYIPDVITKDMWFLGMNKKCPVVFQTTSIPNSLEQQALFLEINGYPVKPYIYIEGNPNIKNDNQLVCTPEEIGWFDEGDHSDELDDISIKQINYILEYYDGYILLEVEEVDVSQESDEHPEYELEPVMYEGKCVIRYFDNDEEDDDDDGEYTEEDEYIEEDEDDEDEDVICSSCNGSGEGQYDGAICNVCGGSGVINDYDDYDDYDYDDDDDHLYRTGPYNPNSID